MEPLPATETASLDDSWLRDFYKECGREVTLAYTTLNQMKNWAITVQAAIVAGIVSFAKGLASDSISQLALPLLVGAVLAYLFTLRFFVRAILCYINLNRWNRLQAAILEVKLLPKNGSPSPHQTLPELERQLISDIRDLYFKWLSTIPRSAQIASNFKLGFGILMVIPPLLMVYALSFMWQDSLAQALIVFSAGATIIEGHDFFTSSFFDTPHDAKQRGTPLRNFPTHSADVNYILQWFSLLAASALVSVWPWLYLLLTGAGPLPTVR